MKLTESQKAKVIEYAKSLQSKKLNESKDADKLMVGLDKYIQKWQTEMFHAVNDEDVVDKLISISVDFITKANKILSKIK